MNGNNDNNENNINNEEENEDDEEENINLNLDEKNNQNKNKKNNKDEYKIMADELKNELNINKNKILNMNYIFTNENSENVFPSKIMENFLGRKRRFNSSFLHKYSPLNLSADNNKDKVKEENKKNSIINYDYSFDNYLHRKMRNLNTNNSNYN